MTLTLRIDGKEKTFRVDFISGRMVRNTIAMTKRLNFNDLSPEELDDLVGFVVDVFGRQFTIDEFYDGIASQDLMKTIEECIRNVVGNTLGAEVEESDGGEKNRIPEQA